MKGITTPYTLVSTYEQAAAAAHALSSHTTLVLDCEGRDLGRSEGVLSIIAIGDTAASAIYLFDILALADKLHPLLQPFFGILRDSKITKLVWDGRGDFLEIADTYGVLIGGMVDVQIVEVLGRGPQLADGGGWRQRHTLDYFKPDSLRKEIAADRTLLDDVYRVVGLDHCAARMGVIKDLGGGKDPAVTALHHRNASEMWLQRPLPAELLAYSARDIQMIGMLYSRILDKAKHVQHSLKEYKEISARYVRVYPTRELKETHAEQELSRFVPMDVLEAPEDGTQLFRCRRCDRMLSLACYSTMEARETDGHETGELKELRRMALCRLCYLVARKRSEAEYAAVDWVLVSVVA